MRVVKGRGNNRTVIDLPCAQIVKAAPEKDQKEALALVCSLAGVNEKA